MNIHNALKKRIQIQIVPKGDMEHNDISTRVIKEYAVQNRINRFKFSYCTILDYKEHVIKSFKGKRMFKSKFPICVAK